MRRPRELPAAARQMLDAATAILQHPPGWFDGDRLQIATERLTQVLELEHPKVRVDPRSTGVLVLSKFRRSILREYFARGPMSARECECLDVFQQCGPSTVRKRIGELARAGYLTECGFEESSGRKPAIVYRITPPEVTA